MEAYHRAPGIAVYGGGCAGTGGFAPEIASTGGPAAVGNSSFGLAVNNGLAGAPALLFLGLGAFTPGLPVGGGCSVYLNLSPFVLQIPPVVTLSGSGPGGGSGTNVFGVPHMPSLLGFSFYFQWVVLDAGSGNGLFTLTSGLGATIQA
ncbi:MAG TPA: hypothetical protein VFI25_10895 [Planctomycetota bacterium]|jgi:hypothetical protein|nr:hypothetical protein [Planctomycetota bacterium]